VKCGKNESWIKAGSAGEIRGVLIYKYCTYNEKEMRNK